MSTLRVTVGAAADRSVQTTFKSIIEAAKKAQAAVQALNTTLGATGGSGGVPGVPGAGGKAGGSTGAGTTPQGTSNPTRGAGRKKGPISEEERTRRQETYLNNVRLNSAKMAGIEASKRTAEEAKARKKSETDQEKQDTKDATARRRAESERRADAKRERADRARAHREQVAAEKEIETIGKKRDVAARRAQAQQYREAKAHATDLDRRIVRDDRSRTAQRAEVAKVVRREREENQQVRNSAWRVAGGVFSAVRRGASIAKMVGMDIARGAGVETNAGNIIGQNVGLHSRATDIVNSGFISSAKGANAKRQDAGEIVGDARRIAIATGSSTSDVLTGLQNFTKKTGDLETGRAILEDMAKLSKATGSNLEDMVDAAGDVSSNLGDVPDKGERIKEVMRAIAAQGKLGAVEISDLAKHMSKLAAAAPQFEGDVGKNMAMMGALAQAARAKGGASSAAMATTSVQGLVNQFTKSSRITEFRSRGIEVESKTSPGKFRNVKDIILDAIRVTNGKQEDMNKLVMDASAKRATRGFVSVYNENGQGERGLRAVSKYFDELAQASMGAGEQADSFGNKMNTAEAKIQIFNEKMAAVGDEMLNNIGPIAEKLGPLILDIGKAAADFAAWVSDKTQDDASKGGATADLGADTALGMINADLNESGGTLSTETREAAEKALAAAKKARAKVAAKVTEADERADKLKRLGLPPLVTEAGNIQYNANRSLLDRTDENIARLSNALEANNLLLEAGAGSQPMHVVVDNEIKAQVTRVPKGPNTGRKPPPKVPDWIPGSYGWGDPNKPSPGF